MRSGRRGKNTNRSKKRLRCRIGDEGLRCELGDGDPRRITNDSVDPGCYVDLEKKAWHCPPVPALHGRRVDGITDYQTEAAFGQGWVRVGEKKIPVAAFPVAVGRRAQGRKKMTNPLTRFLNRFGFGRRERLLPRTSSYAPCKVLNCPPGTHCKCTSLLGGGETCECVADYAAIPGRNTAARALAAARARGAGPGTQYPVITTVPVGTAGRTASGPQGQMSVFLRRANPSILFPILSKPGDRPRRRTHEVTHIATRHEGLSSGNRTALGAFMRRGNPQHYGQPAFVPTPLRPTDPGSFVPTPRRPDDPGFQPGDDCCYDPNEGRLSCPSISDIDGMPVQIVTEFTFPDGRRGVSVTLPDGSGIRVPICKPPMDTPPPELCCVDAQTMTIVCATPGHPWHGIDVSTTGSCYTDGNGTGQCAIIINGDQTIVLPVCEPDDEPDDEPDVPVQCCYLKSTNQIVCEDESHQWHLLEPPAGTVTTGMENGEEWAYILAGGDTHLRMPVCLEDDPEEVPFDCCYLKSTKEIICAEEDHPWHRQQVPDEMIEIVVNPDGSEYVWIAIPGAERVRMLVCPEPEIDCPPGTYLDERGRCVPPPGDCPPGTYRDPSGRCVPPPGDCPPGTYRDAHGNCVPPPGKKCPPKLCPPTRKKRSYTYKNPAHVKKKKACCDSCSEGKKCEGSCGSH